MYIYPMSYRDPQHNVQIGYLDLFFFQFKKKVYSV